MVCLSHLVLSALILATFVPGHAFVANSPPPIYLYASQSGQRTLDRGEGGGNPFASALVELLNREALKFDSFRTELIELTDRKSRGFQRPEIQGPGSIRRWQLLPKPKNETRVALVLVFSDYSASGGASSLPGAKQDAQRVAEALHKAGFKVETVLDPDRANMAAALKQLSARSATADVAVIYTTGHGVEVERVTYLLPGDYPVEQGAAVLKERAVRLTGLGSALRALRANLVFYGGCRDNPF